MLETSEIIFFFDNYACYAALRFPQCLCNDNKNISYHFLDSCWPVSRVQILGNSGDVLCARMWGATWQGCTNRSPTAIGHLLGNKEKIWDALVCITKSIDFESFPSLAPCEKIGSEICNNHAHDNDYCLLPSSRIYVRFPSQTCLNTVTNSKVVQLMSLIKLQYILSSRLVTREIVGGQFQEGFLLLFFTKRSKTFTKSHSATCVALLCKGLAVVVLPRDTNQRFLRGDLYGRNHLPWRTWGGFVRRNTESYIDRQHHVLRCERFFESTLTCFFKQDKVLLWDLFVSHFKLM